jgi:hypothetical protein
MRSIADIDSVAGNASPLRHQLTIGLSFGLALPLAIECLAESELTCCHANNPLYESPVANAVLFKQKFGLKIVDLQADAPQTVPRQEMKVDVGPAVTGAFENCLTARRSVRSLF